MSRADIHAHHGRGQGYFKRAVRWMLEARRRGHDALVLVIDHDGQPDRVHLFNEAQGDRLCSIPRALGVAVLSFDAWMLADERVLTRVLAMTVDRQGDPEEQRDPKGVCAALLHASACGLDQNVMYADVVASLDLDVLKQRCPRGFAPFAERVRALFN